MNILDIFGGIGGGVRQGLQVVDEQQQRQKQTAMQNAQMALQLGDQAGVDFNLKAAGSSIQSAPYFQQQGRERALKQAEVYQGIGRGQASSGQYGTAYSTAQQMYEAMRRAGINLHGPALVGAAPGAAPNFSDPRSQNLVRGIYGVQAPEARYMQTPNGLMKIQPNPGGNDITSILAGTKAPDYSHLQNINGHLVDLRTGKSVGDFPRMADPSDQMQAMNLISTIWDREQDRNQAWAIANKSAMPSDQDLWKIVNEEMNSVAPPSDALPEEKQAYQVERMRAFNRKKAAAIRDGNANSGVNGTRQPNIPNFNNPNSWAGMSKFIEQFMGVPVNSGYRNPAANAAAGGAGGSYHMRGTPGVGMARDFTPKPGQWGRGVQAGRALGVTVIEEPFRNHVHYQPPGAGKPQHLVRTKDNRFIPAASPEGRKLSRAGQAGMAELGLH